MDPESQDLVELLNSTYASMDSASTEGDCVLNVEINDAPLAPGWSLLSGRSGLKAVTEMASAPDLTIRLSSATMKLLVSGSLSVDTALRNGAIKFHGDLEALKPFESLARLIDESNLEREPQ